MNDSKHKSLDLHGKNYKEAEILIDEFIIRIEGGVIYLQKILGSMELEKYGIKCVVIWCGYILFKHLLQKSWLDLRENL